MIFTPENCQLILDGKKTMTRRIVKPDEHLWMDWRNGNHENPVIFLSSGRPKWEVGRDYAICPGRGKKAIGRIVVTDIRRERLQDISEADAVAEGADKLHQFDDNLYMTYLPMRDAFRRIWDGLYGNDPVKGWEANPDVWVISFELAA